MKWLVVLLAVFGLALGGVALGAEPAGHSRKAAALEPITERNWREHPSVAAIRALVEANEAAIKAGGSSIVLGPDGVSITGGITDLVIMKTSHSAFAGFPRDEFTTLPETTDRIFATSLTTTWHYADADVDFGPIFRSVETILLEAFAEHDSLSVQHTLYAMGRMVLDRVDAVESISLEMPNRHHLPIDLTRLGMENRNEVFVATEEPHGLIKATLSRPTLSRPTLSRPTLSR